ncbi:MAG: GntR family transcriptional regulator [Cryobacterium sp.]|nr:GntR family transcriptional regulator [Cryobacterium sp.]
MSMYPREQLNDGPLSKTEYVLERLRNDIAAGTFLPGHQLRQHDVAQAYGVSPTPVREALRLLASDGLVVYARHKGATVLGLTPSELSDLYSLRIAMEGLAVEVAAGRLTAEDIDRLRAINVTLHENRHSWEPAALSALNRDFHFGIYLASSPIISSQIKHVWSATPPFGRVWGDADQADRLVEEHDRIIDALATRDGVLARQVMEQHIRGSAHFREKMISSARLATGDRSLGLDGDPTILA